MHSSFSAACATINKTKQGHKKSNNLPSLKNYAASKDMLELVVIENSV
jgi:hypothetical protein